METLRPNTAQISSERVGYAHEVKTYYTSAEKNMSKSSGRPGELTTSDEVKMDVVYGLQAVIAAVVHQAETLFRQPQFLGHLRGSGDDFPHQLRLFLRLQERGNVFFGDDQHMDRRRGINVPESQNLVVFIHLFGGNGPFD